MKKMNALTLLITEEQQQVQEQTSALMPNISYISSSEQQQSSLSRIIPNSAGQPLYGNARRNQEDMNQEEYRMTYDQKQQCYACGQLNHITSNCEALAALINAGKVHRASFKDWFVDSEDNPRQIKISINNENL